MWTRLEKPVQYTLLANGEEISVNNWLGKKVSIKYLNEINCVRCAKKTKTSFFQGFCYSCFSTSPQADPSVLRPELCEAHNGIARDMAWAEKNSLIDHYVYLSFTGSIKVGVTRHTQIPTRWIDQGAGWAIKLAKTPYRQLAGQIEVELKQYVNDKTNWRKMLSDFSLPLDMLEQKDEYCELLSEELQYYISDEDEVMEITYPVLQYPLKIKSINLDKIDEYEGVLSGIKGQYLIFEDGHVFNVRKHGGYKVELHIEE